MANNSTPTISIFEIFMWNRKKPLIWFRNELRNEKMIVNMISHREIKTNRRLPMRIGINTFFFRPVSNLIKESLFLITERIILNVFNIFMLNLYASTQVYIIWCKEIIRLLYAWVLHHFNVAATIDRHCNFYVNPFTSYQIIIFFLLLLLIKVSNFSLARCVFDAWNSVGCVGIAVGCNTIFPVIEFCCEAIRF